MTDYQKPDVYVQESLLTNVGATSANSLALFVGAASNGPTAHPVRVETWGDYVTNFGGASPFAKFNDSDDVSYLSYLPFAVYSYFQNGGRPAYIQRAVAVTEGVESGSKASYEVPAQKSLAVSAVVDDEGDITLTVPSGHGFVVGDKIIVNDPNSTLDSDLIGEQIVTSTAGGATKVTFTTTATITGGPFTPTGVTVVGPNHATASFVLTAKSSGQWANFTLATPTGGDSGLAVEIVYADEALSPDVFNLIIYRDGVITERFLNLTTSETPDQGLKNVVSAINDSALGSVLVTASDLNDATKPINVAYPTDDSSPPVWQGVFADGVNADLPSEEDLQNAAISAVGFIDQPLLLNITGYLDGDTYVSANVNSGSFPGRQDIFIINDYVAKRDGLAVASYVNLVTGSAGLGYGFNDSYIAPYSPWVLIADPRPGQGTVLVPPGGAVAGAISRIDSTIGVFRAPAGLVANLTNVLGVETVYSDSQLGELNSKNINVIRPVPGSGINIMGARTRKPYGIDRYVSARRTLIYIKESLKRSSQYALFENNDEALWSRLRMTADAILRPLWERGGLRGANTAEAYFIRCDDTINTPAVIADGEVRMEVGVALESPAEFIVIRVSQYESGAITAEIVQPTS